jgi:hypothetical protein
MPIIKIYPKCRTELFANSFWDDSEMGRKQLLFTRVLDWALIAGIMINIDLIYCPIQDPELFNSQRENDVQISWLFQWTKKMSDSRGIIIHSFPRPEVYFPYLIPANRIIIAIDSRRNRG